MYPIEFALYSTMQNFVLACLKKIFNLQLRYKHRKIINKCKNCKIM